MPKASGCQARLPPGSRQGVAGGGGLQLNPLRFRFSYGTSGSLLPLSGWVWFFICKMVTLVAIPQCCQKD